MKKINTKTKLLESTLRLISEKGYLGATTREIAKEAGVTEITLFRHFGSKEKLFEEVLNKYTFLPKLRELIPEMTGLSLESALTIVASRYMDSLKERQSMIKIMLSEVNIYPHKIRHAYNDMISGLIDTLAGYFTDEQKKGFVRNVSPELIARAFLGMIFSYFQTEVIVKGRTVTPSETELVIGDYVDIFIHGVKV